MSHIPATGNQATRRNRRRRYHHHNGTCHHQTPRRNPPKTRVGNGRVLVNGAGRGSDEVKDFMGQAL